MKVFLWCTVVENVLWSRLIQTSTNGISRFSSSSMVTEMLGCLLLRKSRNLVAVSLLSNKEKVTSTYLIQMDGRDWLLANQLSSKWHIKMKDVILVLPYLSFHSDASTRRLKSCVNKFYGFVNQGWRMVNARPRETARQAFSSASPRHLILTFSIARPRLQRVWRPNATRSDS